MNYDIIDVVPGMDLQIAQSNVGKAANVASVQTGSLYFASDFGSDLDYFLQSGLEFQNASFRSYLLERMMVFGVDVYQVISQMDLFSEKNTFYVGQNNNESEELIR